MPSPLELKAHRWDLLDPPEFLPEDAVGRVIDQMKFRDIAELLHFPTPITSVTLSGKLTNSGGAYLELNTPSVVDGESGVIAYMNDIDGACHGELYIYLPGARAGASYLGQLRCQVEPVYGQSQNAYIACNVFGGKAGSQYGRLYYAQPQMVVPFLVSDVVSEKPLVAFNSGGMRNWRVFDVSVRKV